MLEPFDGVPIRFLLSIGEFVVDLLQGGRTTAALEAFANGGYSSETPTVPPTGPNIVTVRTLSRLQPHCSMCNAWIGMMSRLSITWQVWLGYLEEFVQSMHFHDDPTINAVLVGPCYANQPYHFKHK